MNRYQAIFFLLLLLFLTAVPALAHKLNLSAQAAQGVVTTRSTFHGGKPVAGGKIQVYDQQKNLLFEGKTDDKGEFEFVLPKVDEVEVVVNDGLGHRTSIRLKARDLKEGQ